MKVIRRRSWRSFRRDLAGYAARERLRRDQLLFRGESDAGFSLRATLDRRYAFSSDEQRNKFMEASLTEFRRELFQLPFSELQLLSGDALELLARHHGLPSPLLDWTQSPFVASFFALSAGLIRRSKRVAVWMLDRAELVEPEGVYVNIVDDPDLLRFNRRAIHQRAVFMRVLTMSKPVDELLENSLVRFDIGTGDAQVALAELDEMGINDTALFADVDAAVRTATMRLQSQGDEHDA